jgi:hypothetical protein
MRIRRLILFLIAPVLVLATGASLGAATAGAAPGPGGFGPTFGHPFGHNPRNPFGNSGGFFGNTYNCTDGNVPPGNYGSMIITGVCYIPAGNITVRGDLTVAPGALLDAATQGDPAGSPVVPATVIVGGNVVVGKGAALIFGCSPNIFCTSPPGITYDRIGGNLTGIGALGVVVHSASIQGSVSLLGGGGGANCDSSPPSPPVPAAPAPWSEDASLDFTPVYSDFEDVTIGGNLSVSNLDSCWLGSLRDQVAGSATYVNNTMADPDAMEIDNNLIGRNMTCFGNSAGGVPTVQYGDGGAAPNMVGGQGVGQCGFNVQVLNPAAEAGEGPGILEHISVSTLSMKTYFGTHTLSGSSETLPLGVTESGDTLAAELNNVVLAGSGLTGTLTVDPSAPLGSTGEAVASTTFPNGSESFTAFDNCSLCSFDGQSGSTTIRAYGTTSAWGVTNGTFLVTSGGEGDGGLSTLAGYGTFSSQGAPAGTLRLVEHLKIT